MTDLYCQEDAQQILHLAIARQSQSGELTRSQLVEIATELGISSEELRLAEQEWLSYRGDMQERQAFDRYRRRRFQQHFTKFSIVNGFLVVLDLVMTGGLSWSLYVLLLWGLGLTLDGWKTFHRDSEEYQKSFQLWRQQRRLKQSVNMLLGRWFNRLTAQS